MKLILSLSALFLSSCAINNDEQFPCSLITKEQLTATQDIPIVQNGFQIGTVSGIKRTSKNGLTTTYGMMNFNKQRCYSTSAKFELYKPDTTRAEYVVLAHNLYDKGRCLTIHDTMKIKDFAPISLPVDSISMNLIDSVITRIRK